MGQQGVPAQCLGRLSGGRLEGSSVTLSSMLRRCTAQRAQGQLEPRQAALFGVVGVKVRTSP